MLRAERDRAASKSMARSLGGQRIGVQRGAPPSMYPLPGVQTWFVCWMFGPQRGDMGAGGKFRRRGPREVIRSAGVLPSEELRWL